MSAANPNRREKSTLARARNILKWPVRVLLAIIVVVGFVTHGVWVWLHHSLPQVEGTIALPGLTHPVDILRDRYGIPHIYAETRPDALFALGFVHAQDRLFQMEFARRIGQGRLSELLGPPGKSTDKLMRTLDLAGASERALAHLPASTRMALDAYAAGVNAFLAWNKKPLPPEFTLLGFRPEAWRPADSALIIKLMALELSTNAFGEIVNAALVKAQGPTALEPFIAERPKPLPALSALYGLPEMEMPHELPLPSPGGASNNWVVDGRWTASGKPLLANDPHLPLTIPSVWYLAHFDVAGRPYIGATLAGVPGIILGRNDRIAWGYTNTGADVQDLYLERLNPPNKDEYLTPTGPAAFATREETIRVRFFGEERFPVRATRHGPVLALDFKPLTELLPENHVLAMAWPALSDQDATLGAGQALMMAHDCAEFMRALESYVAPMQNMVCADIAGHIGFVAPGSVPIRKPGNDTLGLIPAPGWNDAYDWTGFIPFDALPQALDPPSGFFASANNRIVRPDYPYLISLEWETDERVRRIEALIEKSHEHTVTSFAAMQMDQVSLFAREMVPPMIAAIEKTPSKDPRAAEALRRLADWDGTMSAERPEPLIFMAWIHALTRALIEDELGEELFRLYAGPSKSLIRKLVAGEASVTRWCDDKTTREIETCSEIMSKSFDRSLGDLERNEGPWLSRWRWGKIHEARFSHRLGSFPFFGRALDRQVPTGGGIDTIDRGQVYFGGDHPLANVHGAGYRAIYDLNDPEASVFVISTGQSGNPLSPYYDNLIEAWAHGAYLPMTTRRAAIEEGGAQLLRLTPPESQPKIDR
jgi:penicillin amidase